jgi:thiamine pyrophosphokinase
VVDDHIILLDEFLRTSLSSFRSSASRRFDLRKKMGYHRGMGTQRGMVVTGGKGPDGPFTLKNRKSWFVVAADSGADTAERLGVVPDAVVGDLDSIRDADLARRFPGVAVERHDTAKDWTDTEIALKFLWKRGVEEVTIVGGGGGRIDHLIGILGLFHRERPPRCWLTHRDSLTVIDGVTEFDAPLDGVVSFFPLTDTPCTMRSNGLQWELDGLRWTHGDGGISNECRKSRCRVEVLTGRLLMVQALPTPLAL